jgi:hypothetical protein
MRQAAKTLAAPGATRDVVAHLTALASAVAPETTPQRILATAIRQS